MKNGYDATRPVVVDIVDVIGKAGFKHTAVASYGNHRLQAVRNLMARGGLPASFKIPVVIVFNDSKVRARILAGMRRARIRPIVKK